MSKSEKACVYVLIVCLHRTNIIWERRLHVKYASSIKMNVKFTFLVGKLFLITCNSSNFRFFLKLFEYQHDFNCNLNGLQRPFQHGDNPVSSDCIVWHSWNFYVQKSTNANKISRCIQLTYNGFKSEIEIPQINIQNVYTNVQNVIA